MVLCVEWIPRVTLIRKESSVPYFKPLTLLPITIKASTDDWMLANSAANKKTSLAVASGSVFHNGSLMLARENLWHVAIGSVSQSCIILPMPALQMRIAI